MALRLPLLPLFLLLLLALASAPGPAAAQDGETHTLAGTVVDDSGRPVAGADVRATGPVTRTITTDPSGSFRFTRLPAGSYRLEVDALGYAGRPLEARVGPGSEAVTLRVDASPLALEPLQVVTTTRGARSIATLPIKVDVVDQREVERQQTLVTNPTEALANLIPSFSPGRQKLTSSGESFRGRRPLFLVDGVPQSNPLRDGRRDGFTIGMEMIQRVEVIFGANAVQGLGATGGIVNYITVDPPVSGRLRQRLSLSATGNDGLDGDGLGWRAHYLAAQRFERFDLVASASYETRGLQFDGENRPIALDNVQGDVADSESRTLFAKIGWEPAEDQRLQLTVSDFRLAQDGDFTSVDGDRALGLPAVSVEGDPRGVQPVNDVTTMSLDYTHRSVGGGTLSAQLYWQDFAALFGGGSFGIFQDPALAPVGELFDQSENNSEKLGTRLTWDREGIGGTPVDVVAGFDLLRDRTFQRLVQTDRNWVPETRFLNAAPFVQAELEPVAGLTLSGGLRWEVAELDVPDFTAIAGNRDDFTRAEVQGGSPGFDEPLLNVGAVVTPLPGLRFYGTVSQAFTMPDVGRVLRGVSEPGTAVEDFLDLQPIETDNVEVGTAWGTARSRIGVTWFRSEAELGSRLVPNADGIFQVRRQPTRTQGWELTGRLEPADALSLSAGYSMLEGEFDADDDGSYDADLGAGDIGPDRLNLAADLNPGGRVNGRLQLFRYFDRDFRSAEGELDARFDGYTTVDATISGNVGATTLTLSVANLLDEQYITYFGQAATDRADRFFAGRGRTLTFRVGTEF
jgi:iron complex outermembrane receptor protein